MLAHHTLYLWLWLSVNLTFEHKDKEGQFQKKTKEEDKYEESDSPKDAKKKMLTEKALRALAKRRGLGWAQVDGPSDVVVGFDPGELGVQAVVGHGAHAIEGEVLLGGGFISRPTCPPFSSFSSIVPPGCGRNTLVLSLLLRRLRQLPVHRRRQEARSPLCRHIGR